MMLVRIDQRDYHRGTVDQARGAGRGRRKRKLAKLAKFRPPPSRARTFRPGSLSAQAPAAGFRPSAALAFKARGGLTGANIRRRAPGATSRRQAIDQANATLLQAQADLAQVAEAAGAGRSGNPRCTENISEATKSTVTSARSGRSWRDRAGGNSSSGRGQPRPTPSSVAPQDGWVDEAQRWSSGNVRQFRSGTVHHVDRHSPTYGSRPTSRKASSIADACRARRCGFQRGRLSGAETARPCRQRATRVGRASSPPSHRRTRPATT